MKQLSNKTKLNHKFYNKQSKINQQNKQNPKQEQGEFSNHSPEFAVIQSHRFTGIGNGTTDLTPSGTTFTDLNPLGFILRLELTIFTDDPPEDESEEHVLSTDSLFPATKHGVSQTNRLGFWFFFKLSFFLFASSETLILFPDGPSITRASEPGLAGKRCSVATDILMNLSLGYVFSI